ncbi:MAG: sugar ABC transporter permease [Oligoflexia bacterium]|nr:sugar ABC transporter permease [Oligoflexia bacterium]
MTRKKRSVKYYKHSSSLAAWMFLLPAMAVISVFVVYPMFKVLYLGFFKWNGLSASMEYTGLANYTGLFYSSGFWSILWNSVLFTLLTVPASFVLGLALALGLWKTAILKNVLRSAFFVPVVVSTVGAGIVWVWLFNYNSGIINGILSLFSVKPVNWLGSEKLAMLSVSVMTIWKTAGYNMVIFLAGLHSIPEVYYETCLVDGVTGNWKKFYYITWPLLRPASVFVAVTTVIFSFRSFEQIYAMTRGGPVGSTKILVYHIWEQGFRFYRMGYASAVSVVLLVLVLTVTFVQFKLSGGRDGA